MQRPDANAEKSLNEFGLYTMPGAIEVATDQVGIRVEIPIQDNPDFIPPDFVVRSITKRGVVVDFGNWIVLRRGATTIMALEAFMKVPTGVKSLWTSPPETPVAMHFVDLCWNVGIEPLPESTPPMIEFETAPGVVFADLGWYVPARALDHMIDALGKLNDIFLDGALQDAVLYGVTVR